jgi:hypothetical protein
MKGGLWSIRQRVHVFSSFTNRNHNTMDTLQLKNGLFECEKMLVFDEKAHKYAIRLPDGSLIEEHVISVTEMLGKFKDGSKMNIIVSQTVKSLNARIGYWGQHVLTVPKERRPEWRRHDPNPKKKKGVKLGFSGGIWQDKHDPHISPATFEKMETFMEEWEDQGKKPQYDIPESRLHPQGCVRVGEKHYSWPDFTNGYISHFWSNPGSDFHKQAEVFLNTGVLPEAPIPKEFEYFQQFLKDHPELEILRAECRVCDPEYRLAGTYDAYGKIGDKNVLIDWKRVKDLPNGDIVPNSYGETYVRPLDHLVCCKVNDYTLQLNWYAHMIEKDGSITMDELWLVNVHPENNSYVLLKLPNMRQEPFFARILQARKEWLAQNITNLPNHDESIHGIGSGIDTSGVGMVSPNRKGT